MTVIAAGEAVDIIIVECTDLVRLVASLAFGQAYSPGSGFSTLRQIS